MRDQSESRLFEGWDQAVRGKNSGAEVDDGNVAGWPRFGPTVENDRRVAKASNRLTKASGPDEIFFADENGHGLDEARAGGPECAPNNNSMSIRPLEWQDGVLRLLDQREIPRREVWLELRTWQDVHDAIRDMAVRGAPAIGVAAAYGMALAANAGVAREVAHLGLAASRPTAVNLFWALDRIVALPTWNPDRVLEEAHAISDDEERMNERIGEFGADLFPAGARVMTICNTGSLATIGIGTALGVIRTAHRQGKVRLVTACETRPRLQGLRLTAWELQQDGIPFRMIPDSAAASLMRAGEVDIVIAGADRIAANGDTANKIGTYALACHAQRHGIPFVIAAPSSTIDPQLATGDLIPIEEREASEITEIDGHVIAPANCPVWNPAFDVTPGELISAIVTERGVSRGHYRFA